MSKQLATGIQHHPSLVVFSPSSSSPSTTHDSSSSPLYVRDRQRPRPTPHFLPRPYHVWANTWVKPFLLGVVVAITLTFLVAATSVYAVCHDASAYYATPPSPSCTHVRVLDDISPDDGDKGSARGRFRGLLGLFRNRKRDRSENRWVLVQENESTETATHRSKACACRLIWESLGYQRDVDSIHQTAPILCTPEDQRRESPTPPSARAAEVRPNGPDRFPTVFTPESAPLTTKELELVTRFSKEVIECIPDLEERASKVPWGGPTYPASALSEWFAFPKEQPRRYGSSNTPLQEVHGGNLVYSYLRIMKWPSNLFTHFPFKLCKNGCHSKVAIGHTLEFREKYKPWLVTPSVIQVNKDGAMYHRGFSQDYVEGERGGHGIVWLRPALRNKVDDRFHIRMMVQTLDRAVAASMKRSNGRVGKFNIVIDGTNFSWGVAPGLPSIHAFVTILQDHYVDRLGVVVLVNTGRLCEILLKLFLPLITEEVRNKIIVLPHDKDKRKTALAAILGKANVPTWLGGPDDFEFNVDEYYGTSRNPIGTDSEATEYQTTMPYHSWSY